MTSWIRATSNLGKELDWLFAHTHPWAPWIRGKRILVIGFLQLALHPLSFECGDGCIVTILAGHWLWEVLMIANHIFDFRWKSYSNIVCSPLICQFLFLRATPSQLTQKYLIRNGSTRCSMWCWLCFYPSHLIPAPIRPRWTISSNTIYSLNGVAIRCLSSKIPVLIQPR